MSIVQWTGTASTPWQKVYTNEAPSGKPLDLTLITNAWYDGGQSGSPLYDDMHLAAGLFKFDPELGYPLNRRQLAVAWAMPGASQTSGRTNLQLELWELASPNSPGANPPSQWTLTRYDSTTDTKAVLCFSGSSQQSYASFGLVAGNWAGVKANPASPLWGVGIAYEGQVSQGSATQVTTQLYRVDQNIDSDHRQRAAHAGRDDHHPQARRGWLRHQRPRGAPFAGLSTAIRSGWARRCTR